MRRIFLAVLAAASCTGAIAQQPAVQASGAVIVIPAEGEVTRANDEARATFSIEEQDRDKGAAASRANARAKEGVDILKRADPGARLQTRGYYTYPVYEDTPANLPQPKQRRIVGWRVGQYVDFTTTDLGKLPATVAAAQRVLSLNGISFDLSRNARRELDRQRIEAAYRNLNERVAFVLQAMGRSPADASIETIDFEATGNYAPAPAPMAMRAMSKAPEAEVTEPSFEPGETTLSMRVVGRVKIR